MSLRVRNVSLKKETCLVTETFIKLLCPFHSSPSVSWGQMLLPLCINELLIIFIRDKSRMYINRFS